MRINKSRNEVIAGLALILILIVVGTFFYIFKDKFFKPSPEGNSNQQGTRIGACTIAEQFVEKRLKAPSTADFPACMNQNINYTGNKIWTVESYVDAQNSFGAMLRTYYAAKIEYLGNDRWRLLDLQIKD